MNCPKCQTPIPDGSDVCPLCVLMHPPADVPQPRKCRMAETAEVLAALGFVTCGLTSIPGILLGLVAYRKIVLSEGRLTGRGHAISAFILSAMVFVLGYWVVSIWHDMETTRSISRTASDMRSVATALEAYRTDHATYPMVLAQLTSPVAYVTALPGYSREPDGGGLGPLTYYPFDAQTGNGITRYDACFLLQIGPDKRADVDPARDLPPGQHLTYDEAVARLLPKTYDVTNGTYSAGDILRISIGTGEKTP